MGLDNPVHIAVVVVLLLLLFGAKRLPEIGRSLGSGMREFKDAVTGDGGAKGATQQTLAPAAQPQQPPAQPAAAPVVAPAEPVQAPVEPTPHA